MPANDALSVVRRRRERRVHAVVVLTAVMTGVEIVVGYATHSMALLADGWHMATHVAVLGIASLAYALARRLSGHRAFAFGTGKINALAAYTSAVALGLVAFTMLAESLQRLVQPAAIDYGHSLPVAIVGLVVNLMSVLLLHDRHSAHEHHHDHNHRAAFMHVVADTFTSCLAIAALVLGRSTGWTFLDAIGGLVGGLVILQWGIKLCRSTAVELLDVGIEPALRVAMQQALQGMPQTDVLDLRLWSTGGGGKAAAVVLRAAVPQPAQVYRQRLEQLASFDCLFVEVQPPAGPAL